MTELALILLVKSTTVLLSATVATFLLRRRSAAARHLTWLSAAVVLLLLPLGLLLREPVIETRGWAAVASATTPKIPASDGLNSFFPGVFIWAAGFALCLGRLAAAGIRARSLVRNSRQGWQANGHAVRLSSEIPGALAWSFGRGTVLLPEAARQWTPNALGAALKHETAHLDRRDCQSLLLAELARAFYWFHPLMWFALRRLRAEQEHAADDAVIGAGIDPADYASQLVELARFGRTELLLAGAGTRTLLTRRVTTILDEKRNRTVQNRRMILASAAAILAVALPLAGLQADNKIYRISDEGIKAPEVLVKEEPNYTEEAREAKIEGTVTVTGIIGTDGRLSDIDVKHGLEGGLDQNAVTALSGWVFRPAEKEGVPVRVRCTIEVNFRLV